MQSYPFTSQVTYDEQGMPLYDRAVDSEFLRTYNAQYFEDGIFYKPTSAFQVQSGTGMVVTVNPGACQIQGAFGIEPSQRTLIIQAAETNDRIDSIVLRLDLSLDKRNIDLYVVKGTAAAAPQVPELTRNSTIWELGIANLYIAKNSTTISQARITDTRLDTNRCGVVAQTIGELDTSPYFSQVQEMINELESTIEGIEGGSGFVFSVNGQSGHVDHIATTGDDGKLSESEIPSVYPDGIWLIENNAAMTGETFHALNTDSTGFWIGGEGENGNNHSGDLILNAGLDMISENVYNETVQIFNGDKHDVWHKGMTFKKLWSGSWGNGAITVPGFTDYHAFMIQLEAKTSSGGSTGVGTMVLAFKHPEWEMLRGCGGYRSAAGNFVMYLFAATTSGNTLTFVNCGEIYINNNTAIVDDKVIGIYGIL